MTNPPGITPNSPSQMQTTPSPTSSATLPQQPLQPAPSTSAQPTQQSPTPPAQIVPVVPPHVAKLAAFGQAFQTLAGNANSYSVDPATGQTVTTPQKQAPGQLWRNIIASAIMGGASAQAAHNQNPNMGFGGGVVTGGAAGIQDARQQDILKRQQAQQQFKNQMTADQNNRQQDEAAQRQQLFKAQIAQANADTLRINQQTQGASFDMHQKIAAAGEANTKTYTDSGIAPVASSIPESQMAQYINDHPGSTSLDWEHTGVKVGLDANDQPTYEYTMSAFDPKGPVTISKATVDQWKRDGVFDRYPEYEGQIKAGKQIPAQAFIAIKQQADSVRADSLARSKDTQNAALTDARIKHENAATAHELAETHRANQEVADAALGKKTSEQFGIALEDLNSNGGDFTKIKPSSRVIIGESMSKLIPSLNDQLKAVLNDPTDPNQQQKAGDILKHMQSITSLGTQAIQGTSGGGKVAHPGVVSILTAIPGFNPQVAQKIGNMSPQQIESQLSTANLPDDVKTNIRTALGLKPVPKMVQLHGYGTTISVPEDQVEDTIKKNPLYAVVPTPAINPATGPNNYNGR